MLCLPATAAIARLFVIASCFGCCCCCGIDDDSRQEFFATDRCPPADAPGTPTLLMSLGEGGGDSEALACAMRCRSSSDCVIHHHRRLYGNRAGVTACYLAAWREFASVWRAQAGCRAFVRSWAAILSSSLSPSLLSAAEILYNFRVSLDNLAKPGTRQPNLLMAKRTDGVGISLQGKVSSYVWVDIQDLSRLFNAGGQHSVYAYATYNVSLTSGTQVHSIGHCSSRSEGQWLFHNADSIEAGGFNSAASGSTYYITTKSVASSMYSNSTVHSWGATFNGSDFQSLFYNGRVVPNAPLTRLSDSIGGMSARFGCAKLGLEPNSDASCLRGNIACWALFNRMLGWDEFVQLERWCT